MEDYLIHHGILGMKWGVRRYQNPDGTLTPAGRRRLEKKDTRWAKKNYTKITRKVERSVSKELNVFANDLVKQLEAYNKNGKLSASAINAYNRKKAELMNQKASKYQSPSGKAVQFVAKRGTVGVFMALADQGYNISQLKNGIYESGRVAYRKNVVNQMHV